MVSLWDLKHLQVGYKAEALQHNACNAKRDRRGEKKHRMGCAFSNVIEQKGRE